MRRQAPSQFRLQAGERKEIGNAIPRFPPRRNAGFSILQEMFSSTHTLRGEKLFIEAKSACDVLMGGKRARKRRKKKREKRREKRR